MHAAWAQREPWVAVRSRGTHAGPEPLSGLCCIVVTAEILLRRERVAWKRSLILVLAGREVVPRLLEDQASKLRDNSENLEERIGSCIVRGRSAVSPRSRCTEPSPQPLLLVTAGEDRDRIRVLGADDPFASTSDLCQGSRAQPTSW